jgi:fibronectin-binding autotransporter adhesin
MNAQHRSLVILAIAGLALATSVLVTTQAQGAEWILNGDGNWNVDANWTSPATYPNGIDAVADFSQLDITSDRTINVETSITIGTLTIGDTNGNRKYALQPGTGGTLTFDVSAGNAAITQTATSHDSNIYVPISLNDALDVTNNKSGRAVNFYGSIANNGNQINLDGGNSINFKGGSSLSGAGDLVINGGGVSMREFTSNTSTGDTILNGGGRIFADNAADLGDGNFTINDGVYVGYYNSTLAIDVGTGPGQLQIGPGTNGFSANNKSFNLKLNDAAGTPVVWGTTAFNPTVLVLQDSGSGSTITGSTLNFYASLDLNGANRTILEDKGPSTNGSLQGYARMISPIINSDGGNAAGLIKEGIGTLVLSATNTYDGGTTVNGGAVQYDRADSMPSTGNTAFNNGTELWVRVGGSNQFTAASSGAGSLGGLLSGTGTGTSTVSYSGDVDLVLRPSSSPTYAGAISDLGGGGTTTNLWIFDDNMTLSGANTYSGSTIFGRRGGSARTLTLGSSTALPSRTALTVDSSGSSMVDLAGNNATIGKLTTGSNNGGARGQVTDSVGGGVLTLTDGVYSDDHNSGGGGIFVDTVDLNGAEQLFEVRDGHSNFDVGGSTPGDFLITSVIQNGSLKLVGLETNAVLRLEGSNTYTGTTTVESGILSTNNVTAFADASSIVIGANGTLNLDHFGTDLINALTIDGTVLGAGVYNAGTHSGFITGAGSLSVVPEPSTFVLAGLGLFGLIGFRRRRK